MYISVIDNNASGKTANFLTSFFLPRFCVAKVLSFSTFSQSFKGGVVTTDRVRLGWLSSVRFKYKPGYRSCDLLQIRVPSLVENWFCHKNPLQDLLDSLNSDFLIFKKLKYDNFEQSWLYFWFYCNFEPFQFLKICALLRREHIEISYLIMV